MLIYWSLKSYCQDDHKLWWSSSLILNQFNEWYSKFQFQAFWSELYWVLNMVIGNLSQLLNRFDGFVFRSSKFISSESSFSNLRQKVIIIQTFIVIDNLTTVSARATQSSVPISPDLPQPTGNDWGTKFFQGCNFSLYQRDKFIDCHRRYNSNLRIFNICFKLANRHELASLSLCNLSHAKLFILRAHGCTITTIWG